MAETLKRVVVEDQTAKRQFMNAEPITNEWWYDYKHIDKGTKETAVIIPSDELINFNRSVYNSIISGDIKFDINNNMIEYPKRYSRHLGNMEIDMSYFVEYMKNHASEYASTIADARDLIGKLFKASASYDLPSSVSDKIADKLFQKFGFVKVYSKLKSNQDELEEELKNKVTDISNNTKKLSQYPELKDELEKSIVTIFDNMKIDKDGNIDVGDITKQLTEKFTQESLSKKFKMATADSHMATVDENTTTATSAAPVINPVKPLHPAPVDSEPQKLTKAFVPDGAGNVTVNLTDIVNGSAMDMPPVDVAPEPTVFVAPQPTETVTPPPTNMSNPKEMQPEVRVKKDKGDLKDVKSPEVSTPLAPMTEERKKEFISHNPALTVVENKLGSGFRSVYRIDSNFVYIDIYAVDKPDTKIDWMSMTVDLSGHVFGRAPKFWPGSDNKEPVDFMPALHLTDEALTAYWSGEGNIPDKFYYAVKSTAELNKKIDISSIFSNTNNVGEVPEVIKVLTNEVFKSSKVKNKLKDGRLRITSYVSPQEFTLAPMADVHKYVGGPLANNDVIMFNVVVKGGKVVSVL